MAHHGRGCGQHGATRHSHVARNVVVTVLLVLVVLAGAVGFFGYRFYREAVQVKTHETAAVRALTAVQNVDGLKDAGTVTSAMADAQQHATAASQIADGALWKFAQYVPVVGDDVTVVRGMVSTVDDLVAGTLPQLVSCAQNLMSADLSDGKGQLNLQPIVDEQENIAAISAQVHQQVDALNNLPEPHIGMVKDAYSQGKEQLGQVSDLIDQINDSMQMLPAFFGVQGERTYILAVQTTSEQRSGGGLVGSLAAMTTNAGKIAIGDFHSDAEFISVGGFANDEEHAVFDGPLAFSFDVRDAFAVPEVSRVAEMLRSIWQGSAYATNVDGVIAIDPVFIQEMVKINGDVKLPNGATLNGNNTAEYMLNTIYKDIPHEQQDAYFEFIAKTVMDGAFTNMTASKLVKVAQVIGTLAENRHCYAYTFHNDEARYFQGAGLAKNVPDSETEPAVGIYMNEQNSSKLGWYLQRKGEVTKTADNADGSATYHVTYTLTNSLTAEEMSNGTDYILGGVQSGVGGTLVAPSGTQVERMLFYAPAGGSISNFQSSGTVRQQREATMDGKALTTNVAYIAPGDSVTFDFDVTTSPKAATGLTLDQTPGGWLNADVTYRE